MLTSLFPYFRKVAMAKPKERCELKPRKTCKFVTRLLPRLVTTRQCSKVPKEVCSMTRIRKGVIKRPVVKKWCGKANGE